MATICSLEFAHYYGGRLMQQIHATDQQCIHSELIYNAYSYIYRCCLTYIRAYQYIAMHTVYNNMTQSTQYWVIQVNF
jgi:hypothetical protein